MWRYGTALLPATAAQVAAVTAAVVPDHGHVAHHPADDGAEGDAQRRRARRRRSSQAKPANAFDLCYLTGDTTFSTPVTDMALCDADPRLATHASPRQVAGGSLDENILKCQLKPLEPGRLRRRSRSRASQWTRLNAAFPGGVCDWSKPGVGQQDAISPLTFAAGPGGVPLPPAPTAQSRQH